MPLIKLSRINKGGEIVVNSDNILFIEVESRYTTVHLTGNMIFSVEEPLDSIAVQIESIETARIKNAIQQSGLVGKPA
jgi:DNA-binding LytR/AlgR family response regulator